MSERARSWGFYADRVPWQDAARFGVRVCCSDRAPGRRRRRRRGRKCLVRSGSAGRQRHDPDRRAGFDPRQRRRPRTRERSDVGRRGRDDRPLCRPGELRDRGRRAHRKQRRRP